MWSGLLLLIGNFPMRVLAFCYCNVFLLICFLMFSFSL
uniref:Uncharacterized protein n=1 Tax=Rhizophora mucronata TaxID=61149 RepID=A0A2P2N7F9_RHIMU